MRGPTKKQQKDPAYQAILETIKYWHIENYDEAGDSIGPERRALLIYKTIRKHCSCHNTHCLHNSGTWVGNCKQSCYSGNPQKCPDFMIGYPTEPFKPHKMTFKVEVK